jgi:hypothetical protein
VTSWTLLRHLKAQAAEIRTDDISADLQNDALTTLHILIGKLEDEIVARLSELSERKIGQLTFHFAAAKLGVLNDDVLHFRRFIEAKGFVEKRNLDISHKALPQTFADHRYRHIRYRTISHGVAMALRLMKRIDRRVLGPSAPYLWREMRKKRYVPMTPPSAGYMIMPYLRLGEHDRARIVQEELNEGRSVLTELPTLVNGEPAKVLAAKEWGGIVINGRLIMLDHYPIQKLDRIDFPLCDA